MAVMSTLRGRVPTQQRALGTRYDSLVTSPSPSEALPAPVPSDEDSEGGHSAGNGNEGGGDDGDAKRVVNFEDDAFKTSWADDEVPEAPATPLTQSATASPTNWASRNKMPHNASVFIGSLPTNMSEVELKHDLQEHLAQFANVHRIKLIHDHQKGCISAFVQCEDAEQANQLVAKSPKPFHGRMLRYESARAHRSLFVSYKKSRIFIPSADAGRASNDEDTSGMAGHWLERDLPLHMRVILPHDSKCAMVFYNNDALHAVGQSLDKRLSSAALVDQLGNSGRLFSRIKYDENTMHELLSCFGPIEYFKTYVPVGDAPAVPPGHDMPRSPSMDDHVWEVKWEHRDDCIAALNTLKSMPHICVSWTAQRPRERTSPSSAPFMTRFGANQEQSARQHDVRTNSCYSQDGPTRTRHEPPSTSSDVDFPSLNPISMKKQLSSKENVPLVEGVCPIPPNLPDSSSTGRVHEAFSLTSFDSEQTLVSTSIPEHLNASFVDISMSSADALSNSNSKKHIIQSGEIEPKTLVTMASEAISNDASPDEIDTLTNVDGFVETQKMHAQNNDEHVTRPGIFHRRSMSNPAPRIDTSVVSTCDIPSTPELSGATYSPESPLSAIPPTPLHHPNSFSSSCQDVVVETEPQGAAEGDAKAFRRQVYSFRPPFGSEGEHREIDPKTIFVGGLENSNSEEWSEERLRTIFGCYGTIEHVKYVCQNPKKAAFAFITFSDENAAPKAIASEHNRIYGGRVIRVQIRDIHPARNFRFRNRVNQRPRFGVNFNGQYVDVLPRVDCSPNASYDLHDRAPTFERAYHPTFSSQRKFSSNDIPPQSLVPPFVVIPRSVNQHQSSIGDTESLSYSQCVADSVLSADSDARTAVSITPPPSTTNSSMPTSAIAPVSPQTMCPPIGYYNSQPWPSPYAPAMFPFPVGTYGQMMPQVQLQYGPVANANGTPMPQPLHWGPPMIPYPFVPVLPSDAMRPMLPSAPDAMSKVQASQNAISHAQGEHGSYPPAYQQEALNQYVGGSPANGTTHAGVTPPSSDGSVCTSPVVPAIRPPPMGLVSPHGAIWPGSSVPTPMYPYPPSPAAFMNGFSPPQFISNQFNGQTPPVHPWGQARRMLLGQSNDISMPGQESSSQLNGINAASHPLDNARPSRFDRNSHPRRGSSAYRADMGQLRSPARLEFDRHGNSRTEPPSGLHENVTHHQVNYNVRQQGNAHNS